MNEGVDSPGSLRFVAGVDRQAGALAWMPGLDGEGGDEGDGLHVWLVTSRRTARWVLPKGGIDAGMTPSEAAAQEALEEAGLTGIMADAPVGIYRMPKIRPPLIWTVEVELYPMQVTHVAPSWLEQNQRQRRLVSLDEAHDLIAEPDILLILRRFAAGL